MAPQSQVRRRMRARTLLSLLAAAAVMLSGSAGYTVRSGDTLWSIAQRHGISVAALSSANGLSNPNVIHPGTQLSIPGGATSGTTASTSGGSVHVVAPGETLMGISIRYQVMMRDIAAANGFDNLNWVYAGQRLRIPSAGAVPAAVPAAPAAAAPSAVATAPLTTRADVGAILDQAARDYGFSPAFVKALAYQESGWNQSARSSVGAIGVMQVMPSTGDFIETYLVNRDLNLADTHDNVTAGVAFLSHLWRLTGGDVDRTLAGYYQGLQSVKDNGMYPSTRTYIANIKALRARF